MLAIAATAAVTAATAATGNKKTSSNFQ